MVFKVFVINVFKTEGTMNNFYRELYKHQMKILTKKNITNINNSYENSNRHVSRKCLDGNSKKVKNKKYRNNFQRYMEQGKKLQYSYNHRRKEKR